MAAASAGNTGNLTFSWDFESGNACGARRLSNLEWEVSIRGDTLNPRFRVWFYFAVGNAVAGQRAVIHVVGHSKTRSLFREGMTPVARPASRRRFHRLPARHVWWYRASRGDGYVLSFAFRFSTAEPHFFAFCYPYTFTALQAFLSGLESRPVAAAVWRRQCLCRTVQQRRLDLITVASPRLLALDAGAYDPGDRSVIPVVFVTARVHPGETPASFVMEGLLEFLVSDEARDLRSRALCKLVPMLNPDGVVLGNHRSSSLGLDLNRQWLEPSAWAAPTVHAVHSLMASYNERKRWRPALCLDVHAHSVALNGFLFCNHEDDGDFPKRLSMEAPELIDGPKVCVDPGKEGTGRQALLRAFGCPSYTLEVSFFAGRDGHGALKPFGVAEYLALGRAVGRAIRGARL